MHARYMQSTGVPLRRRIDGDFLLYANNSSLQSMQIEKCLVGVYPWGYHSIASLFIRA
jgi:hypothetical protein